MSTKTNRKSLEKALVAVKQQLENAYTVYRCADGYPDKQNRILKTIEKFNIEYNNIILDIEELDAVESRGVLALKRAKNNRNTRGNIV